MTKQLIRPLAARTTRIHGHSFQRHCEAPQSWHAIQNILTLFSHSNSALVHIYWLGHFLRQTIYFFCYRLGPNPISIAVRHRAMSWSWQHSSGVFKRSAASATNFETWPPKFFSLSAIPDVCNYITHSNSRNFGVFDTYNVRFDSLSATKKRSSTPLRSASYTHNVRHQILVKIFLKLSALRN